MPDDKPITPEDEKPTSTLSRLSVVFLFITTIACVFGAIGWAINTELESFYGKLCQLSAAVWIVFLSAIYISGRYKEVHVECDKVSRKVGMRMFIEDDLFFWIYPFAVGCVWGGVFWFLNLIPRAIHFFGGVD